MVRNYITSKYLSGTTKSNIELSVTQLKDNGLYEISDPVSFLSSDIFVCIQDYIHPRYTVDDIKTMLLRDGKYFLQTYILDDDTDSVVLVVDNSHNCYYYDLRCGFISRQIYNIKQIDDENVGYLVTEHLIKPFDGCKLIERCYVPYFKELRDAEQYQSAKMRHYVHDKGTSDSGFRISVIDTVEIIKSDWYNMNLQAMENINKYQLNPEDYRYIDDIKDVLAAVKADSYDDLSIEEQASLNMDIYNKLYDYIPLDYRVFIDDDLEQMSDDEFEDIADRAIVLSLVNADSEETFNKIHELLGPNEYRVGAITDDIYNDNAGKGYIVMCRDGEMGYYSECYCINEWEGAKGNPFYGKFMKNENDTLLCLREYHPELIVGRLPRKDDIAEFEKAYLSECAIKRQAHTEMTFDLDDEFEPIVIGTWYPKGLQSPDKYDNITFYRDYGSHTFTTDECRTLLNGEELVIKNFKTKSDSVITIRGILYDCTSDFDDEMIVRFVRTDIDIKRRRALNAGMGIEEPNLPVANDTGM